MMGRVRRTGLAEVLLVAALTGCSSESPQTDLKEEQVTNQAMVRRVFDQAAENAIAAEHAVYPYHFVPNQPILNELGEKQVDGLAAMYKAAPGNLVIVRGEESPQLYDARVKSVLQWLSSAGVHTDRMVVSSDLPGGPGMSSVDTVNALESRRQQQQPAPANASAGNTGGRQ